MSLALYPRADYLRLRGVIERLTPARMRAAFTPGWIGWFAQSETVTPEPVIAAETANACAWGRYMVAQPSRPGLVNLDGDTCARFGNHVFLLFWQTPGPGGYETLGVEQVLLACEEAKGGTEFAYLLEGATYPSAPWQPGFWMTTLTIPYRATFEVTA